jgi:cysteinyl-tRNA synthetase
MSKSLGNFITIRDFLKQNTDDGARILRFLMAKTLYRSPIDYSEKSIIQAKKELERIDEFIEKLKNKKSKKAGLMGKLILTAEKKFDEVMDDDFNTPKAVAVIFHLINKGNSLLSKNEVGANEAKKTLEFLRKIDKVFNFIFWQKIKEKIPREITELVKKRGEYRRSGNWQKSDEIRKKIKEIGFWVEDTKQGVKIKKL